MACASSATGRAAREPSAARSAPCRASWSSASTNTFARSWSLIVTPQPEPRGVTIVGTGMYVPDRILTNRDLEQIVDTSDEWIRERTGIEERRIAAPDQASSDMAL